MLIGVISYEINSSCASCAVSCWLVLIYKYVESDIVQSYEGFIHFVVMTYHRTSKDQSCAVPAPHLACTQREEAHSRHDHTNEADNLEHNMVGVLAHEVGVLVHHLTHTNPAYTRILQQSADLSHIVKRRKRIWNINHRKTKQRLKRQPWTSDALESVVR